MRHARKSAEIEEMIDIDERLAPYFALHVPGVELEALVPVKAAASAVPPAGRPTHDPLVAGAPEERTNAQSSAR